MSISQQELQNEEKLLISANPEGDETARQRAEETQEIVDETDSELTFYDVEEGREEMDASTEDPTPWGEISVSADGKRRRNPYHLGVELEAEPLSGVEDFETFGGAAEDIADSEEHNYEGLETLADYLSEGLLLISSQDPENAPAYIGAAEELLESGEINAELSSEDSLEGHANLIEAKAEETDLEGYDKHVIVGPYTPGIEIEDVELDGMLPFMEYEDSSGDKIAVEFCPTYETADHAKYRR